jgi:outer membrane protein assembly factor BamB
MLPLLTPLTDFAVVPIFVNAGAALFPALIAGVASIGALLFKPKELIAAVKRKPWVPVLILGLGLGIWLGWPVVGGLFGAHAGATEAQAAPTATVARAGGDTTDWTEVAKKLIEMEAMGGASVGLGTTPTAPTTEPTTTTPTGAPNTTDPKIPSVAPVAAKLGMGAFFRSGPTRSGFDGGKMPLDLTKRWAFTAPNTYFFSSPTVLNGRVYAASCLFEGANPVGSIYCFDAATGSKIWEFSTLEGRRLKGFFSSPALTSDGKFLVIGQGLHTDANSSLICVDAAKGTYKWHKQTPMHIEGSPAIEGDVVVAGVGAIEGPAPDHKPVDGNVGFVIAVQISTSKELWRHTIVDPESSPVLKDGIVYIGSGVNGNAVVALRAENGTEIWRTPTPYAATGAVTLAGDLLLIGGGRGDYIQDAPNPAGMVMALYAKDGKVAWKTDLGNAVLGAIAVQGTTAVCTGRSGKVVALDIANKGAIKWQCTVDSGEPLLACPAFTGKYVYAVSKTGLMATIDAATGKVVGKKVSVNARPGEQGMCFSSPTIAGGRLYVGSENGGLRCYEGKVQE